MSALPQHLSTCLVPQTLFVVMFRGLPRGCPPAWLGVLFPNAETAGSRFENLSA